MKKTLLLIATVLLLTGCSQQETNKETTQNTQNYSYPQHGFAVTIPDELKETTSDKLAEFIHTNADPTDINKPLSTLTITVDDEIPTFPAIDESPPTGAGVSEVIEYTNPNSLTIYEVMISDAGSISEIVWTKINDHYIHFHFYSHSYNISKNLDTNQYKEEIINSLTL